MSFDPGQYWQKLARDGWERGEKFLGLQEGDLDKLSDTERSGLFAALSAKQNCHDLDTLARIFSRILSLTVKVIPVQPGKIFVYISRHKDIPSPTLPVLQIISNIFVPFCYIPVFLDRFEPAILNASRLDEMQLA